MVRNAREAGGMSPSPAPLLLAAALPEEISAVRRRLAGARRVRGHPAWRGFLAGRDVTLLGTGDGAARAGRELRRFLAAMPCSGVVGYGIAGGLTSDLGTGDVVATARVVDRASFAAAADPALVQAAVASGALKAVALSVPAVVLDAAGKRDLAATLGSATAVVDLESAAWAAAAIEANLPWVVLRAVSDALDEDLPHLLRSCVRSDGTVGRGRAFVAALARPAAFPRLFRLRRRVLEASVRLAAVLEGMMEGPFRLGAADVRAREAV
jgi:adenosylhomocysteine nucleosidase